MKDSVRIEIERYLDGAMSPDQASAFLDSLRQDPEALAFLGRALEDQAHLFDAIRARAKTRGDTTRRLRVRRKPNWPQAGPPGTVWIIGAAAVGLFALLLAWSSSGSGRPVRVPPPREVAITPPAPAPEHLPVPPPERPEPPPPLPPAPPPKAEAPVPRELPALKPEPEPPRPEPAPVRDLVKPTVVAMADLNRIQGDCVVLDGAARTEARAGSALLQGQGCQTGAEGLAVLKFPDATRVELGPSSVLRDCSPVPSGKRLRLESGKLTADVAKQPAGAAFLVTTPQAEIAVLGTRFSVACTAGSTRVDVREGRVRVARLSDGAAVEVPADHFATIAPGSPVEAKPIPIDEIVLTASQGKILGGDWKLVNDVDAAGGAALEALKSRSGAPQEAPCVSFTVNVDAGKTYSVWVRGKCGAKTNRVEHDSVIVEFSNGEVTEPPGPNKGLTGSPSRGLFNGFMVTSGYGWVGSDSDRSRDVPPVTVRFAKPGRQTLRLYASESPMRIDALWLSATQKTRPDDSQTGPKK